MQHSTTTPIEQIPTLGHCRNSIVDYYLADPPPKILPDLPPGTDILALAEQFLQEFSAMTHTPESSL